MQLLERRIAQLAFPNVGVGLVTASAFPTLAETDDPFISLFLFQIAGNAEMRNRRQALNPDGSYRRQSLPLELCYLVTAWGVRADEDVASDSAAAAEEARLLGAVMQSFYDNAEVGRGDLFEQPAIPVWEPHDGLQIVMETLPVESHYRIWDAAELGYHLSLVYRARVASLDPVVEPPAPPVLAAELGVT